MRRTSLPIALCLLLAACGEAPQRPVTTTTAPSTTTAATLPATAAATPPAADAPPAAIRLLDAADAQRRAALLPTGTSWEADPVLGTTLRATVPPATAPATALVRIPLDLAPWRGCLVALSAQVRADAVSKPGAAHNGIKVMLHWRSPTSGERHVNPEGLHGTFPWREARTVVAVDDDATGGDLSLGLQDSSGTADIAAVAITVLRRPPARPAARWDAEAARAARVTPMRGVMSPHAYRAEDFATLAAWNVNLVRWQISHNWGKPDTDRDLGEYDAWLEGKLRDLDRALADAAGKGIKLAIDLHQPPGGRYADRSMAIFREEAYQRHFIAVWERIARRYKGHPAVWAYDLINEPVQDRPSPPGLADWYGLQVAAARAIRAIDPDTPISIAVDAWDSPPRFRWLEPVPVDNVIYQVHMYQPGEFTHQGAKNDWGEGSGNKPVSYPGEVRGRRLDRETLRAALKPVRDFQLAHGARIYVGEFSAIRWAPGADRYLADCIDLFEEYGWDWTYHAFREWGGWSVEHQDLPYSRSEHIPAPADQPTARAKVLFGWFARNQRAPAAVPPAAASP